MAKKKEVTEVKAIEMKKTTAKTTAKASSKTSTKTPKAAKTAKDQTNTKTEAKEDKKTVLGKYADRIKLYEPAKKTGRKRKDSDKK